MKLSFTEENYLKAIYLLANEPAHKVANLSIAEKLQINPATVTEMLRKLHDKKLVNYNRAHGASLTKEGEKIALKVLRKHRIWETFLVQNLAFSWDEVHEVAEQLEHIQSDKLLEQLDKFLGYPKFDPHGDPIPDKNGKMPIFKAIPLSNCTIGKKYKLIGVSNHSPAFLQYLDKINFTIGNLIEIKEINEFDKSLSVVLNGKTKTVFSYEVSRNLLCQ